MQPSHPRLSPSPPAFKLPQHQLSYEESLSPSPGPRANEQRHLREVHCPLWSQGGQQLNERVKYKKTGVTSKV